MTETDQPEWVTDFLAALCECPNVTAACRATGVTRQTAYRRRETDAGFAGSWDEAVEASTDELVGEAYKRAKTSDTLLIFLLKSHRRKVYGDRVEADLTSGGESFKTVLYLPGNGRDAPDGPVDPPAAGPPGGVPLDPG